LAELNKLRAELQKQIDWCMQQVSRNNDLANDARSNSPSRYANEAARPYEAEIRRLKEQAQSYANRLNDCMIEIRSLE
jgi:uncharacterized protein YukE